MRAPKVLSIGTAVPSHSLSQNEIKGFAASLFRSEVVHLDRLLPVFDNGCIHTRHLTQPLSWYADKHSFAEANAKYAKCALELAKVAAQEAIESSGILRETIGMVIFVSSTGIVTPTLEARLIQDLGLPLQASRLPIWGLGCAGGVSGLGRAAELFGSNRYKTILFVAVELCSLTFQRDDYSKSNIVGSSIFADGAAAAILSAQGDGPEIIGCCSMLFPDTEDVMGWDLTESGLKVRFSRDIPSIIRNNLPGLLDQACRSWGVARSDIKHFVVHPGGAKVLAAYADCLGIPDSNLQVAHDVLSSNGNMSSCSVMFVLNEFLHAVPPSGDYGVMLALGPGFSSEQVLFRW